MSIRNYTNTGQTSTLVAAIGATDTSFTLNNYAGDPTPPFTAALARGTATEEIVLVTGVSVNTVTVTRGYDGTSAQAQGAGATFQEVVVAQDFREANVHVNATTGVHGVTGAVVGTSDTQTLTNKTLTLPTLSSPTITGSVTIASATVSGTLSVTGTTTLAALTLGSLSASGNATVGGTLGVTGATTLAALTAASAAITGNATVGGTLGVTGAITGAAITGSGLVKGAGVESTAGLTLAQIAAPSGVASKGQVWAQSDGGLYTREGTGAVARVPVHWGAGTAFPSSGVLDGDLFRRTDLANNVFRYNAGTSAWENESASASWPIARAHAAAVQGSIPGSTWTQITLGTVDIDTASAFASSAFTVPSGQGGIYAVEGRIALAAQPGLTDAKVYKNGVAVPFTHGTAQVINSGTGGGTYGVVTGRQILTLAAGDVITLRAYNDAGNWATNWNSDDGAWLSIERIR